MPWTAPLATAPNFSGPLPQELVHPIRLCLSHAHVAVCGNPLSPYQRAAGLCPLLFHARSVCQQDERPPLSTLPVII